MPDGRTVLVRPGGSRPASRGARALQPRAGRAEAAGTGMSPDGPHSRLSRRRFVLAVGAGAGGLVLPARATAPPPARGVVRCSSCLRGRPGASATPVDLARALDRTQPA